MRKRAEMSSRVMGNLRPQGRWRHHWPRKSHWKGVPESYSELPETKEETRENLTLSREERNSTMSVSPKTREPQERPLRSRDCWGGGWRPPGPAILPALHILRCQASERLSSTQPLPWSESGAVSTRWFYFPLPFWIPFVSQGSC